MVQAIRSAFRRSGAASISSAFDPLPRAELQRVAPSIFADDAHETRSDRYTFIPTIRIVDHLEQNGYGVFAAMQSGSRAEDRRGHTKHLVRFRPLNQQMAVGGTFPEIVLVNSHDGSSAYKLMAGTFRLVCGNGLIVAQSTIDDISVRHTGDMDTLREVAAAVGRMRDSLPLIGQRVEQFQRIRMERESQEIFARAALTVRYGAPENAPIPAVKLLEARRTEDVEPTLWNTVNTVQESLIRGGHRYRLRTARGTQRRTTGAVNSVDGQTSINRAVWQLAEEMAKFLS